MQTVSKETIPVGKEDYQIKITPEEQVEANYVRNKFREQFACHFIPDINVYRENLDKEIDPAKIQQKSKKVHALTSQFSHIAFELPNSLETYDTNTHSNYQTFIPYPLLQKNFKFSVIVDRFNINHLLFQNGTFFAQSEVCYFAFVPKQDNESIQYLQGRGYSILGERRENLKVGHKFDLVVPFNNSDEIFFFSKHFLYYHFYNFLQGCDNVPGVFSMVLNQLVARLKKIFEGFFKIEGEFLRFSLKNYLNSNLDTQRVYDKYIFSQVREFNKIHKSFLYMMQIANVTGNKKSIKKDLL